MHLIHAARAARAIIWREMRRFVGQRARFAAALVRPLVWLFVFAAGFRAALGLSIIPPYQTYITYETYILPGLCGMILLFSGMQASLSLVHEQESGAMRLMLSAPLPRWFLLAAKLLASALVGLLQVIVFIFISYLYGIKLNLLGYLAALPALILAGVMLGAMGLFLSSKIKHLENFAGVMNFVIFPMFFMSSALYPLWKMQESSPLLAAICHANPFTYAVEFIRFSFYLNWNAAACLWTIAAAVVFFGLAVWGYEPMRAKSR